MSIFPPTSSSKTKTGNFWSDWAFQELYMMWNKFWPQKPIFEGSACHFTINPIQPSVFGSKFTRGYNGREVPKLSWNLISYRDWCQTKGFTTFRYLEPPQLMVWKSNFFRRSVRLGKMDQLFKFLGKRWFFLVVYEVRKGPPLWNLSKSDQLL